MGKATIMAQKNHGYSPEGLAQLRQVVREAIEAERVRQGLGELGYRLFADTINQIAGETLYDKDAISRLVHVGLKRPRGSQKPDLMLLKHICCLENFPYTYEELKAMARGEVSLAAIKKKSTDNHPSLPACHNLNAKVVSERQEDDMENGYQLMPKARRRLKNWLEEYFRSQGYEDEEDFVDEACAAFGEQRRAEFRSRFSSMLVMEEYLWNDAALEPLLLLGQVSWTDPDKEMPVLDKTKHYESVKQVIAVLESNGVNRSSVSK